MTLLEMGTGCSHCRAPHPCRITERERERYMADSPGLFVGTWRCPCCQRVNRLEAAAYQQATAPRCHEACG